MGHEDQFAPPGLSGRSRFCQATFTGTDGNGRGAPKPAIPQTRAELVEPTPKRPLVVTGKTAGGLRRRFCLTCGHAVVASCPTASASRHPEAAEVDQSQVSDFDPFKAVWAARHALGDRVGGLLTAWTECRTRVLMVPEACRL
jgi:hypothetical protein